jgi:succinate dehydrogenase hydrophobic anchor subunit
MPIPPPLESESRDAVWVADRPPEVPRSQRRTSTGLLVMTVAFALLWIPYVSDLGELLAFIGVVYLWLGRSAFNNAHRRWVGIGSLCVILALLTGVVVGLLFIGDLYGTATTPGETLAAFVSTLQSSFVTLFEANVVLVALSAFGYVALPYALADPKARTVLWSAMGLSILLAVVMFFVLAPQISMALAQATSGGTINTAPVAALETREALWGLVQFGPDVMFLWAYHRIHQRTFLPASEAREGPRIASKFGRADPP